MLCVWLIGTAFLVLYAGMGINKAVLLYAYSDTQYNTFPLLDIGPEMCEPGGNYSHTNNEIMMNDSL